jgi:hypothetical protein
LELTRIKPVSMGNETIETIESRLFKNVSAKIYQSYKDEDQPCVTDRYRLEVEEVEIPDASDLSNKVS